MIAPLWEREIGAVRSYLLDVLETLRSGQLCEIVDEPESDPNNRNYSDGWEVLRVRFAQAEMRALVCARPDRMAETFSEWETAPLRVFGQAMRKAQSLAESGQKAVNSRRPERIAGRASEAIKALDVLEYQLGQACGVEAA